jgi:hypothetical protein
MLFGLVVGVALGAAVPYATLTVPVRMRDVAELCARPVQGDGGGVVAYQATAMVCADPDLTKVTGGSQVCRIGSAYIPLTESAHAFMQVVVDATVQAAGFTAAGTD